MTKEDLLKDGFIPLIEYEERFADMLLISFPSFKYRKGNVIASVRDGEVYRFDEITSVEMGYNGYRIPTLINIDYEQYK